jgi:hypothetical protein
MITRRSFFGLLATPAIIRTPGLLMPIKPKISYIKVIYKEYGPDPFDGSGIPEFLETWIDPKLITILTKRSTIFEAISLSPRSDN